MKFKWLATLIVTLLSLTTTVRAQEKPDPNFYIFLSFGQSNAEGYPGVEEMDKTVDPRLQMLAAVDFPNNQNPALARKKGEWYTAVPPLCRPGTGISPSDYFGRTLIANLPPDIKVGIVNVSVAGCKIEMFQKTEYKAYLDAPGTAAFLKNIAKQYSDNPYQHLVDMAKLAQKKGVIKGITLHQGESNVGDEQWPAKVKGIYTDLLKDLDLKAENVPLLVGELVSAEQGGKCASHNKIIDKINETIPTAWPISSASCPARGDGLHFLPAGYRVFGQRYGVKMLELMGKKESEIKLVVQDPPPAAATAPAADPAAGGRGGRRGRGNRGGGAGAPATPATPPAAQ